MKKCFQVRVRSSHKNQFSMEYIKVSDSDGDKWKISGEQLEQFQDWTTYKSCWYKLVKQKRKTKFMARTHHHSKV